MKILLFDKIGCITRWPEDIAADLTVAGHAVAIVPTRNPWLAKSLERALWSPAIGAPLAAYTCHRIRQFAPDLIVAVGVLDQFPKVIVEHVAAMPCQPPLIAWIGDVFTNLTVSFLIHRAPLLPQAARTSG